MRSRLGSVAAFVLLGAALAFPLVFTLPYPRDVMIRIFLYAMLATAWNVLAGYCGQISLGHAVFFGTGAYTSTLLFQQDWLGVWASPWVGMALGALLAALLSQIIGYPVFRLRGHYFAIATIAVGEIVQTIVINWDAVGGARGLFVPIKRPDSLANFQFHESKQTYYYIALALLVLAIGISRGIVRSRTGYYFRAIREDQDAAAALGIPVARYKQRAMAISVLRSVRLLHRPRVGAAALPFDPRVPGGGAGRGRHAVGSDPRLRHPGPAGRGHAGAVRGYRQGARSRHLRTADHDRLGGAARRHHGPPAARVPPLVTTPLLDIEGVTKRFGGLVANREISFRVGPGEPASWLRTPVISGSTASPSPGSAPTRSAGAESAAPSRSSSPSAG